MENNKLPTIKEIAKRLNVSTSTVSRALNNHPRIGLGTKMKVQQLAKELNYQPNAKAISFKQGKSHIIGVIIPYIREEFFSQAISGIEAAAMVHDYTLLFGQSYDDTEREKKVMDAMKKQRVDGLIISLAKQTINFDHLKALDLYNIPVVYFDRVPSLKNINKVYCNLFKGTVEMVGWLISRGYKKIGFINGPKNLIASKERLDGYIEGLAKKKLKVNMQMVEETDLSKEGTWQAMKNILSHSPNAIITFNDYVHMDAVQYAQEQKIRVNKDVLFLSYANLPITGYTAYPPLVSVEQYPYGQGERAMEILNLLLNEKHSQQSPAYYTEEIPATLVVHQSTRPQ